MAITDIAILQTPTLFIFLVGTVIAALMTVVNKFFIDQDRMKEIQLTMKKHNKKLMKATKAQDTEALKSLDIDKPKIMQMQKEMMKMQMPVFISTLPLLVIFMLLRKLAESQAWGEFLIIPWAETIVIPIFGPSLGWLGWYILVSLVMTTFFRKITDIH